MTVPTLFIFDCDGVLIDSQTHVNEIFKKHLSSLGLQIDQKAFNQRFTGKRLSQIVRDLTSSQEISPVENIERTIQEMTLKIDNEIFEKGINPNANAYS